MGTLRTLQARCSTQIRGLPKFALVGVLAFYLAAAESRPLLAFELELLDGQVAGALDSRLSFGVSVRVADRDDSLIGIANGGTATGVNGDDGNLNYDKWDVTSAAAKATHELELHWRNFGFFSRVFYFYDIAVMDLDTARTNLSDAAKDRAGMDFRLLDLYGTWDKEIADSRLTLRGGNQIINWGESTFIQNGLNAINPVDVSALIIAGAELRNALLPMPAVDLNVSFPRGWSLEGFYQLAWDNTKLLPRGTFFSDNDFISPGSEFAVVLGGGTLPDNPPLPGTFAPRVGDSENAIGRGARHSGQFGFALRYFAAALNDIEFGLYYQHYHSHLPLVSATAQALAGAVVTTATYTTEFPEDINLIGASFNTDFAFINNQSLALQGEVTYRPDQPLQIDDAEIIVAALNLCDVGASSQLNRTPGVPGCGFAPGEKVEGFKRKQMVQAQMTGTYVQGATLGANRLTIIGEVGGQWFPDLERKDQLRYEAPDFADWTAWGYRLAAGLEYLSAIGAVNLEPVVAFEHDVSGTSPSPVSNFVEDVKAVTLSLTASYLTRWEAEISYTNFFGAGNRNSLKDRDHISMVVSYAY